MNSKHIIFHPATTATDCVGAGAGAGAGPLSNGVPTGLTLVLDGGRVVRVILAAEQQIAFHNKEHKECSKKRSSVFVLGIQSKPGRQLECL